MRIGVQRFVDRRFCVFCAVILLFGTAPALAEWKTGAAKVLITPDQPLWMAGYGGRDHAAEGKLTDLWAKALVLEDGRGCRAVLITLDLVGLDRKLSQSIREAVAKSQGIGADRVSICVSHTHTGPVVGQNLAPLHYLLLDEQQRQWIDQYAEQLQLKILEAARLAAEKLAPSRLSWGSGVAAFAVNRRENPEANVPQLRTQNKLVGPVDHDVPVLAVSDAAGQLKTVLFGYACHATVLSFYQWSGDYPGFACSELESLHPDCIAMFWAGCGADQNPLPRRTVELARHYGRQLADAVDTVLLTSQLEPVADRLEASYREVSLRFDTLPTREQLQQESQSATKQLAARAQMLLKRLDAGEPLSDCYPYPIAVWRLGNEVTLVMLGGEVVVDYSLLLKSQLSGKRTWVAGYSNDIMAYIPSRRVLLEGRYEGADAMVYYGLPTRWNQQVEETIAGAAVEMAGKTAQEMERTAETSQPKSP